MLCCYLEFKGFAWQQVRATIDCPVYMRRMPDHSPREHLEMQQILDARREAQEARDDQRRLQHWNLRGLAIVAATSVAAVVIGLLNLILG